jgi:DNA-binding YbaB/EbfC family protein
MNINPFDIMKNAQKIQDQMGTFQEKLGAISITGSAGGGMAEIDMNGKMELLALRIAPEAMGAEDREMLQDLITAAFNDAMEKVREAINQEIGSMIPGGIAGIPGFLGNFPGIFSA